MPDVPTLDSLREEGLLPFQAEFVRDFLVPRAQNWELVVPVGLGKTYLGANIATRLMNSGAERTLILAPASLLPYWHDKLVLMAPGVEASVVTRKQFLELEANADPEESIWPSEFVAVMSLDLAKRDDMARNIQLANWDLLVVDESHMLRGRRRQAFVELLESGKITRFLLLSIRGVHTREEDYIETVWARSTPDQPKSQQPELFEAGAENKHVRPPPPEELAEVHVSDEFEEYFERRVIRREDILDWQGNKLLRDQEHKILPLTFKRTAGERKFLEELISLSGSVSNNIVSRMLLQSAFSSPIAAETTLRRLSDSWGRLASKVAHEIPLHREDFRQLGNQVQHAEEVLSTLEETTDTREEDVDFGALSSRLISLLESIDDVRVDTKLERLVAYLKRRFEDAERLHICLWTSFLKTAEYLVGGSEEIGVSVHSITGSLAPSQLQEDLSSFHDKGGILVTTDVALQGITLEFVDECVVYDLPMDSLKLDRQWGRFDRFGRTTDFRMLVLLEENEKWILDKLSKRPKEGFLDRLKKI